MTVENLVSQMGIVSETYLANIRIANRKAIKGVITYRCLKVSYLLKHFIFVKNILVMFNEQHKSH